MSSKEIFLTTLKKLKNEHRISVTIHNRSGNLGGERISAYVRLDSAPYGIHLYKSHGVSYSSLLYSLLHEVGHVADYKKKKKTTRVTNYNKYLLGNEKLCSDSKLAYNTKIAVLATEYMADLEAKLLMKKYDLYTENRSKALVEIMTLNVLMYKYALNYGKEMTRTTEKIIRKSIAKGNVIHNIREASSLHYSPCRELDLNAS